MSSQNLGSLDYLIGRTVTLRSPVGVLAVVRGWYVGTRGLLLIVDEDSILHEWSIEWLRVLPTELVSSTEADDLYEARADLAEAVHLIEYLVPVLKHTMLRANKDGAQYNVDGEIGSAVAFLTRYRRAKSADAVKDRRG